MKLPWARLFQETNRQLPHLIIGNWGILLFLLLINHMATFEAQGFLQAAGYQGESLQIQSALLQMGVGLLTTLLLIVLIPGRWLEQGQKLVRRSIGQLLMAWMKPLTIESLRAAAYFIMGLIVMIIPGIYYYLIYSFVPFVVIEDPEYARGEVDALAKSKLLVRPILWWLLLVNTLVFLLQILTLVLQGLPAVSESDFLKVLISVLTLGLSLYTYILSFQIYLDRRATNRSPA